MPLAPSPNPLLTEFIDLLATGPTPAELAAFRPSPATTARASDLLAKLKGDGLTPEEDRELTMFQQVELMLRLVKARIRHSR